MDQKDIEESRLKIFFMDERKIVNLLDGQRGLCECYSLALEPRLPEGYSVRGIHYEPHRRAFSVVIHHPSFEPVHNAAQIPWIDGELPYEVVVLRRGDDGRYEITLQDPLFQANTARRIASKEEDNFRRILELSRIVQILGGNPDTPVKALEMVIDRLKTNIAGQQSTAAER